MDDLVANKTLITEFIKAQSEGNLEQAWSMLDHSGTWWVLTERRLIDISDYVKLWDRLITRQFPDGLRLEILDMVAEGEKVAVRAQSDGTTADGRQYNNIYFFQFQIRDGLIIRGWEHSDTDHVWRVLRAGTARPDETGDIAEMEIAK